MDEIGVCVARHWKFPEAIIYGMRSLPEGMVDKPQSVLETIRHFSIFANEICEIASYRCNEQSLNQLIELMKRFEPSISISEKDIFRILFESIEKIKKHASVLEISPAKSRFLTNLFSFAKIGESSELFQHHEDITDEESYPVQPEGKAVNSDINGKKPDGFQYRFLPLFNKFIRKK